MDGSRLVLGTWQFDDSYWAPVTTTSAKAILRDAERRGIVEFDTAESYGNGRSEQLLGQTFKGVNSIRIATKSIVREPDQITRHLERSLRRMNRSSLDLFYIHWPRKGISLEKALERLASHRDAGTIRRIGVCNLDGDEEYQRAIPMVDAVQVGYNLIWRRPERTLLPLPVTRRPLIYAYSPLAQGLLARRLPPPTKRISSNHRYRTPLFSGETGEAVFFFARRYHDLCDDFRVHPGALALSWLLRRGIDRVVFGVRSTRQLEEIDTGLTEFERHPEKSSILEAATALSDQLQPYLPELPNLFGYVPAPVSGIAEDRYY